MDNQLTIRTFTQTDTDRVIEIWQECGLTVPQNVPATDIQLKTEFQPELFFVAEKASQLTGTIMAGYEGHRGWLNYLGVLPAWRRQGIGTALVRHALEKLKKLGCPKVNLMVRKSNLQVIEFYKKLGFLLDEVVGMGLRF